MAGKSEEAMGWSETLQNRLREKMDGLIEAFLNTGDPVEIARIEKEARTCGVFARSVKAIETMVPEQPSEPHRAEPATNDAANDDEASMHDGIPEDPEELHAALVARFTRFAELLELKRRADLGDGDGGVGPGEAESAAPA